MPRYDPATKLWSFTFGLDSLMAEELRRRVPIDRSNGMDCVLAAEVLHDLLQPFDPAQIERCALGPRLANQARIEVSSLHARWIHLRKLQLALIRGKSESSIYWSEPVLLHLALVSPRLRKMPVTTSTKAESYAIAVHQLN